MPKRPTLLLASTQRPEVSGAIDDVLKAIAPFAEITATIPADDAPLPRNHGAQRAIAIGGDGTVISQARRLIGTRIPLIGVNVGKLGFLAEFDAVNLRSLGEEIFGDNPPTTEHVVLEAEVVNAEGTSRHRGLAVNDTVITSGADFHMIQLQMRIDGTDGPMLSGDGVIVATPAGSTAYNVSAGGPIVHPAVDAMTITPLAAHSLAFRPIVISSTSTLEFEVQAANAGTTLVQDGQPACRLNAGDRVSITVCSDRALFVRNSQTTYWHILLEKMRWAAPPSYRQ